MPEISVSVEDSADTDAVRDVVTAAFGRNDEAELVDALRESPAYCSNPSLVAHLTGDIVGYVMFAEVTLDEAPEKEALVLAPLAVDPDHQRMGVGTRLVHVGLEKAREAGYELVFLHGDPDYYERFGFTSAVDAEFENPFDMPDESFQVCDLTEGTLDDVAGTLTYPAPFRA
ncbi:GNAT family N-acetyltransferase [Haladaptatus caseinilyticus]|uniref:GNAT family N-acetyltransferase n=1 Tax=Haladaptatus caseinilyticus TaxID=2993314 RepID=UPI00224B7AB7|nr:N-acetyltransferase [Haladaptatus caseinilyticus]